MIRLRFNDFDEYLGELRRDAELGLVERLEVRYTRLYVPNPSMPTVHGARASSSYVKAGSSLVPRLLVVFESAILGELGWRDEVDAACDARLDEVHDRLRAYARSLNLEAHPGILEPAEQS